MVKQYWPKQFISNYHWMKNYIFFFQMFRKDSLSKKNALRRKDYQERWHFFFPEISSYSLDGKWKMIFLKKIMEIWYFFQIFWKDGLSKKNRLEYDLSCIIWKDDIPFCRKYDLILWTENERWSFSKKYMKIWYFLQMYRKDNLSKKIMLEYDHSCIIWKDGGFFFRIVFLQTENEKWSFSRNTWKYDIFCIYVQMLQIWYYSSAKKKQQRWSSPEKIHLKVIDILDCILERGPMILCTFMETFIGVCIYCFPVKNPGNLIYRIEIWLCLQFIWLEISCNE